MVIWRAVPSLSLVWLACALRQVWRFSHRHRSTNLSIAVCGPFPETRTDSCQSTFACLWVLGFGFGANSIFFGGQIKFGDMRGSVRVVLFVSTVSLVMANPSTTPPPPRRPRSTRLQKAFQRERDAAPVVEAPLPLKRRKMTDTIKPSSSQHKARTGIDGNQQEQSLQPAIILHIDGGAAAVRPAARPDTRSSLSTSEKLYIRGLPSAERVKICNTVKQMQSSKAEPCRVRVLRSALPHSTKEEIFRQLADKEETSKYQEWVDRALLLPCGKFTAAPPDSLPDFIANAKQKMDSEITGQDAAKQEVLRMLHLWVSTGATEGFALGLEGEAGVGKTTFVKRALSQCMHRPFHFISLGGASDAAGLLGHTYTYEGATPGRLAECVTQSKVMDPVIFFDELDKVSASPKGEELINALIHITDTAQNQHIRDRYFHGIDMDLSRATLIFSYNDAKRVNPILLDRIKRIRMTTPGPEERVQICVKHLVPRAMQKHRSMLEPLPLDVVQFIVDRNASDPGMRSNEKDIDHVISSYCLVKACGAHCLQLPEHLVEMTPQFAAAVLNQLSCPADQSMHMLMYS